jgi:hypothetical protein
MKALLNRSFVGPFRTWHCLLAIAGLCALAGTLAVSTLIALSVWAARPAVDPALASPIPDYSCSQAKGRSRAS